MPNRHFDALWQEQIDFGFDTIPKVKEPKAVTSYRAFLERELQDTFEQPTHTKVVEAFALAAVEYHRRYVGSTKATQKQLERVFHEMMERLWVLHLAITKLHVYEPPAPPPRPTLAGQPLAVKESRSPLRS